MPPSSATAYNTLTAFKPRSTTDLMQSASDKYGVGAATDRVSNMRGLVSNLSSAVEAVDPSVTGRTSGTFTTEGQRQALVSRERAPILTDLGKQQTALGNEQSNLSNSQTLATQMASALLSEDNTTYQRLLDQYNSAVATEKAAEEKRQWEAQMAEQKRQFDEQLRQSQARTSYNLASAGAGAGAGSTTATTTGGGQTLAQFLQNKYSAQPTAPRALQDEWVKIWAKSNGRNVGDASIWQAYNDMYPWEKYNDQANTAYQAKGTTGSGINWGQALKETGNNAYKALGIGNAIPNIKGWLGMR